MGEDRRVRARRSYRPGVEALEALRLLAGASTLPLTVPASVEPTTIPVGHDVDLPRFGAETWDAALSGSLVADLIAAQTVPADAASVDAGLGQIDRYLNKSWHRAGIPPHKHDDCTQAVYATLLQSLGRPRFDAMAAEVGACGIKDVLSRETREGVDFFRAIDTVKKRAQRERSHQPIDSVDVADGPGDGGKGDWGLALREVIDRSLNPREAALIEATLRGQTPAEIAHQWGLTPKTVSNEKSRAIQKLRVALVADLDD